MIKRIPDIIRGLLIFLFAYTACSKILSFHQFESVLRRAPLIGEYATLFSILIPASELLLVVLLLLPKTQRTGLKAAFILLLIFTLYLGFMVITVPHLPCTCGGVIQKLSWKQHIWFNLAFVLLTFMGICFQPNTTIPKENYNHNKPR